MRGNWNEILYKQIFLFSISEMDTLPRKLHFFSIFFLYEQYRKLRICLSLIDATAKSSYICEMNNTQYWRFKLTIDWRMYMQSHVMNARAGNGIDLVCLHVNDTYYCRSLFAWSIMWGNLLSSLSAQELRREFLLYSMPRGLSLYRGSFSGVHR